MRSAAALRALAIALGIGVAACRRSPPSVASEPGVEIAASPGLSIDLTPRSQDGALDVEVRVVGPKADTVRELRIAREWAGTEGAAAIDGAELADARGPIALDASSDGSDEVLTLARAPSGGDLRLRYRARAAAADAPRFAIHVDSERASGVGHAFLLLPRIDAPIAATIRFHLAGLPRGAGAVTSFGVGLEQQTTATSEELAHAVYAAGRLDATDPPGKDDGEARVAIVGKTRLAPLAVLGFAKRALGVAGSLFRTEEAAVRSFVLVAEPGLGRAHEGASLDRALGIWFGEDRTLDAQMKIVIAHEILHRWIGGAVRLRGEDGRTLGWFTEGFTAHYARRALFDAGVIDEEAFLEDLRRTTSDDRGADSREDDAHRGALYAASLDAAIRRASDGARSLDAVMQKLLAASAANGDAAMPVSALRDLVVAELGRGAGEELDRLMLRGEGVIDLPDDAFGPCFERARSHERFYELGFDRASIDGTPSVLRRLVAGSAADKAGLREGAIVLKAKIPFDADAKSEVDLTVADHRGQKRIRYKPEGARDVVRWRARSCQVAKGSSP